MNGTQKREAAAARIPCFELNKGNVANPVTPAMLTNARRMIRAAVAVVEAVHGGDTAAKDAGAEFVGTQIGGKLASGEWTGGALLTMNGEKLDTVGSGVGQVAADYVAGIEAGA